MDKQELNVFKVLSTKKKGNTHSLFFILQVFEGLFPVPANTNWKS